MQGQIINLPEDKVTGRRKGFGFIKMGDGSIAFFHRTGLSGVDFGELRLDDRLEFDLAPGKDDKGPRAENVRRI